MSGDQLDLDAIEAQTRHRAQWGDDAHCDTVLALVAEVRRLRALVEMRDDYVDEACPTPASLAAGCDCEACERARVSR